MTYPAIRGKRGRPTIGACFYLRFPLITGGAQEATGQP